MDKNVIKVALDADNSLQEQYTELIETLNKKKMNFSRVLLSVDSKIAYVQMIPAPITPIRGVA